MQSHPQRQLGVSFNGRIDRRGEYLLQTSKATPAVMTSRKSMIAGYRLSSAPVAGSQQEQGAYLAHCSVEAALTREQQHYNITAIGSRKTRPLALALKGFLMAEEPGQKGYVTAAGLKTAIDSQLAPLKLQYSMEVHAARMTVNSSQFTPTWTVKFVDTGADAMERIMVESTAQGGLLTQMVVAHQPAGSSSLEPATGRPLVIADPVDLQEGQEGKVKYIVADLESQGSSRQLARRLQRAWGQALAASTLSREQQCALEVHAFIDVGRDGNTVALQFASPAAAATVPAAGPLTIAGSDGSFLLTPQPGKQKEQLLYACAIGVPGPEAVTGPGLLQLYQQLGKHAGAHVQRARQAIMARSVSSTAQAAEPSEFDMRLWVAGEGPVPVSTATAKQAMDATYTTSGTSMGLVLNASSRRRTGAVIVALYSAQDAFAADCAFTEPEFVIDGKPQHGGISYLSAAGGVAAASKQPLSLQTAPLRPINGAERMERSKALAALLTNNEFPNTRQALQHLLLENPSTYTIKDATPPTEPEPEEDYFDILADLAADTPGSAPPGDEDRQRQQEAGRLGDEEPPHKRQNLAAEFEAADNQDMQG